jgi:hypothetical protein
LTYFVIFMEIFVTFQYCVSTPLTKSGG